MKKFLYNVDKSSMYDYYRLIVNNYAMYSKVTRFEMYEQIQETILNDLGIIDEMLFLDDILNMLDIINVIFEDGVYIFERDKTFFDLEVYHYFLFSKVVKEADKYYCYMDKTIMDYIYSIEIIKAMEERAKYFYVILGMLEMYGSISFEDLDNLYQKIREVKYPDSAYIPLQADQYLIIRLKERGVHFNSEGIYHHSINKLEDYKDIGKILRIKDYDYYYNFGFLAMPLDLFNSTSAAENNDLGISNAYNRYMHLILNDPVGVESFLTFLRDYGLEEIENPALYYFHPVWPIWEYGGHSLDSKKASLEN